MNKLHRKIAKFLNWYISYNIIKFIYPFNIQFIFNYRTILTYVKINYSIQEPISNMKDYKSFYHITTYNTSEQIIKFEMNVYFIARKLYH